MKLKVLLVIVSYSVLLIAGSCKKEKADAAVVAPGFKEADIIHIDILSCWIKAGITRGNEDILSYGFLLGLDSAVNTENGQFIPSFNIDLSIDTFFAYDFTRVKYLRLCAITKSGPYYSKAYKLESNYVAELNYKGGKLMAIKGYGNYAKFYTDSKNYQWIGANSMDSGQLNQKVLIADQLGGISRSCEELDYAGYTDWFVPSVNELEFLFQNKTTLQAKHPFYWSNTEYNADSVYIFNFTSGNKEVVDKYDSKFYTCTCIRRY